MTIDTGMTFDKYVFFFGKNCTEGNIGLKPSLGGKGAALAEMSSLGLPIPPGFTLRAELCQIITKENPMWPEGLADEVDRSMIKLEGLLGKKFGDSEEPLFVSVRSGAAVSLPGMMDTILNLGLNDITVKALARNSKNERFAWDSYRRLMQMFGDVALGINRGAFEDVLDSHKERIGAKHDTDLSAEDLKLIVADYQKIYANHGQVFPQDAREQLRVAVNAVLESWNNPRAIKYRAMNDVKGLYGTAVNIQAMVFGNMGESSGTGVCFTRDPSTGENKFIGEYLMNAQGEDVVAGIRTPLGIHTLADTNSAAYEELLNAGRILEGHFHDVQDIEFTIMNGKLYLLQTRNAKRTTFAFLRTNIEMLNEGLIDEATCIKRMPAAEFPKLFAPVLSSSDMAERNITPFAHGLAASPGGASGHIVFTAKDAEREAALGKPVILVRVETSPEDIGGMAVAKGVITSRGGLTSHAAVVARGMGCPAVCGISDLVVDYKRKTIRLQYETDAATAVNLKEGDWISLDGFTGNVFADKIAVVQSEIVQSLNGTSTDNGGSLVARHYHEFMNIINKNRKLGVRANADTPNDALMAVKLGCEGIGLCRTEHMFFQSERVSAMRQMILAKTKDERVVALNKLLHMQKEDFKGIYQALDGRPCTVRLLDPPLHEFLPHTEAAQSALAAELSVEVSEVTDAVNSLHEMNPMLGFRGCRLALIYPEILEMQVRAIMESAIDVNEEGVPTIPEIMIPLVGNKLELAKLKVRANEVIQSVFEERGTRVEYKIGTMIEVPRAALTADAIAKDAEFFSFGTNDLTQMTLGFSRDDVGKFMPEYLKKGIYEYDPFKTIDVEGVGMLVEMALKKGRSVKPDLKVGICGEHGGDPKSIKFFNRIGLDYVSCSPFRVPVALLAAAQAHLGK